MEKLYFALVDTPGFFASIIRKVIKQNYIHVAMSLDLELTNAYSIGRRNPAIPFFAGFTRENSEKILQKFPNAKYRIVSIDCTKEQKENVAKVMMDCYRTRFQYHYCIIGLFFILFNKPFYQYNHFTCTSFAAKILEENGIIDFKKHFSLVTPKDFYELKNIQVEYEGTLQDYVKSIPVYKLEDGCYET